MDPISLLLLVLPMLVSVTGVVGMWSVFGIAVYHGTVDLNKVFPSISECGDKLPASCWFSLVCNFACLFALIFELFLYLVIIWKHKSPQDTLIFAMAVSSFIGLSITGNFQASVFPLTHRLAAVLAVSSGLAHLWMQLMIMRTRKLYMIFLNSLSTVMMVGYVVFYSLFRYTIANICEWTMATCLFICFSLFTYASGYQKYSFITSARKHFRPER